MKRLVLDQLKRRWLIVAGLCLVQFIAGLIITLSGEDFPSSLFPIYATPFFMMAFLIGPNTWLSELQQGYARVALMLPFTAAQIGRILWWISVGFATLLLALFSLLGVITTTLVSHPKAFGFEYWFWYVAGNSVVFGSAFWLSSGTTISWKKSFAAWVSNAVWWGCLIGGGYFLVTSSLDNDIKFAIFFLTGAILTVLGWHRAEGMVADYGEHRPSSQQPHDNRGQFAPPDGHGGIPLVFQNNFARVWGFGLLLLIFSNVAWFYISHQFDWHHLTKPLIHVMNSVGYVWGFLLVSRLSSKIYNLRFLRTLPIATGQLGCVLLGEFILPVLTLCLAITALAWYETGSAECLSWFKIEFLGAATVSIFISVIIWNTQAGFVKAILLIALVLGAFVPVIYEMMYGMDNGGKNGLSWGFVAGFTIVVLAGSYWATGQILARSSSAYRVRQNPLASQRGWGSWGR